MKCNYTICITKSAFKNAAITYTIKYSDNENPFLQEINESVDANQLSESKQSFKI